MVEEWLVGQSLTPRGLSYQSGTLVVSTAGSRPPKSSEDLTALINARFKYRVPVSLAWTRLPATSGPDDAETALATVRTIAATWASTRPDTTVLSVTGSARAITLTLIGKTKPDVDTLQADVRTALPQATITIQWVPGDLLIMDTPTPLPTARLQLHSDDALGSEALPR